VNLGADRQVSEPSEPPDDHDRRPSALDRVDTWQRRHRVPGFVVGVLRKGSDDRSAALSGLVAHYAFFSLFPLLLVLVTVAGWALADRPDLRDRVLDSAVSQVPVIGSDLRANVGHIEGNGLTLVLGLATALWAGLGMGRGLQHAFDTVWSVATVERPLLLRARLRALAVVGILGGLLVLGSVAAGVVAGVGGASVGGRVGGAAITLALVAAAMVGVFHVLSPREPWSDLWPGALVTTACWAVLQVLGAWFVNRVVSRAGDTYGVFAVVIGLLVWLTLLARTLIVAAEVNVVRARRLWPRSLMGPPMGTDPTEADREAYRLQARAEQRLAAEVVDVTFPTGGQPSA
jgi:YihY family inner membrane protein